MILYDGIMLFLCLDAKETKVKGGETFYKEKLRKTALPHPNSLLFSSTFSKNIWNSPIFLINLQIAGYDNQYFAIESVGSLKTPATINVFLNI